MQIVFMGTPRFAVPSLSALIAAGHGILAIVTQPDKPSGRGLESHMSPVKEAAIKSGIRILTPFKIKDCAFIEELGALKPDVIVVVAYGKILPEEILNLPRHGCINVHASILPKYRGASPINRAIMNGDRETGVCTMLLDKGMDTGAVFKCSSVEINPDETAGELTERLSVLGAKLIVDTLSDIEKNNLKPAAQDSSKASSAPLLKKEDGLIDWAKSASEIKNLVRGVTPWPGAYTRLKGTLIKIHRGDIADTAASKDAASGSIIATTKDSIIVKCGVGAFSITELQPENKRRMSAPDFSHGHRLKETDRFE